MSESDNNGLVEKINHQSEDIKNIKSQLDSFRKSSDNNKDGKVSLKEGTIWFKHAWDTPSGRKLIFNFLKSCISVVSCLIAIFRMGYDDPALTILFFTIIISNLGMLTDAANETDMLNFLYSLVDIQRQLNEERAEKKA